MNRVFRMIALVTLTSVAAIPVSAKTKHLRHHAVHTRAVQKGYVYNPDDPAGPPQRPVYSSDGRLIGRADDPNIRLRLQQDDYFNHAW